MNAGFFINFVLFFSIGILINLYKDFFGTNNNFFIKLGLNILYGLAILLWLLFLFRWFKYAYLQNRIIYNSCKKLIDKIKKKI